MKKLSLIFGLALGMLTVGCSQDGINDQNPIKGETVTLGVTLEEGEDVRTSLGDLAGEKYSVVWSENDKVSVNGKTSAAVDAQFVGGTTASFTVEDVVAPYDVLYPADALNEDGHLVVATSQAYTAGTFANGVAVMAGTTTSTEVSLKHLFSFVKLTVAKGNESGEAFKSVTITSLDGRAISGHFEVDYATPAVTPAAGEGHDAATVASVPFVDGKAVVYVAVPAGDYSKGFEVKVVGSDDKVMTKTAYTETGIELPAGYLIDMPELTYAGETSTDKVITTATELVTFLSEDLKTEGGSFKGTAKLGNDIDMAGVNLASLAPMPVLLEGATLDGQGYALKNWTTSTGLIYENYGTIKNIVLDKSCALTINLTDTTTLACGFIVNANLGLVSGCVNNATASFKDDSAVLNLNRFVGPLVGCLGQRLLASATLGNPDQDDDKTTYKEARIENCVNNGNVTITASSYNHDGTVGGWMYVGGVAGAYLPHKEESNGGVYNCVNNGTVTVNISMASKNMITIGGILGAAGKVNNGAGSNPILDYCHVENCVNNGDITFEGCAQGNKFYLAGISGISHAELTSCTNNGEVKLSGNTDAINSEAFVGGVTSLFSGNITDCHNKKSIKVDYIYSGFTLYVGGIASKNITYYKSNTDYQTSTISGCTNSGSVDVRYYAQSDKVNGIGGILGAGHNGCGIVNVTNCENIGTVTAEVASGSTTTSRPQVGGIGGDIQVKVNMATFTNCTNSGAISLIHNGTAGNLGKDATVGGLVGTDYASFYNCKSLGAVSISGEGLKGTSPAMISPIGCRLGNWGATFDGCEIDCAITYPTDGNVLFGLIQSDTWVSAGKTINIGATKANVVKSTTTINGVAVTADFIANTANIVGRSQKDGEINYAEGGIVLQ